MIVHKNYPHLTLSITIHQGEGIEGVYTSGRSPGLYVSYIVNKRVILALFCEETILMCRNLPLWLFLSLLSESILIETTAGHKPDSKTREDVMARWQDGKTEN